jgi:hypothetical protein
MGMAESPLPRYLRRRTSWGSLTSDEKEIRRCRACVEVEFQLVGVGSPLFSWAP